MARIRTRTGRATTRAGLGALVALVGIGLVEASPAAFATDPSPVTVTVGTASVVEGNTGTKTVSVAVTLSEAAPVPVTVDYALSDGTATAPDDYVAAVDSIEIPAGETAGTIDVVIKGDTTYEPDEDLTVTLTSSSIGTITASTGSVTITNDDAVPVASIPSAPVEMVEGNSGTTDVIVPITLSNPRAQEVTVGYYTQAGSASNITSDYKIVNATMTFAPGETSKSFAIKVNGDLKLENNETFIARIGATTNASTANTSMKVTILNDEKPKLTLARPAAVNEGRTVTFKPRLSHSYYLPITVTVHTVDGTATAAAGDFTAVPTTPFVIAKGDKGPVEVEVQTLFDNTIEPTETFSLFATSTSTQNSVSNYATIKQNVA